jgi:hypothetical protein
VTLREEHRLRVFENRVLRRIFGLKRDEVMGEWRKLHNKDRLCGLLVRVLDYRCWGPGFDSRAIQKKK